MVLVKRADERGFCFFTNAESRKGMELQTNPQGSPLFPLEDAAPPGTSGGPGNGDGRGRCGRVLPQPVAQQPDRCRRFAAEPAAREPGGAGSPLPEFAEEHPGEVPRPPYWRGFCVYAEQIEFWINGENRLHDRFLFTREAGQWLITRLYP